MGFNRSKSFKFRPILWQILLCVGNVLFLEAGHAIRRIEISFLVQLVTWKFYHGCSEWANQIVQKEVDNYKSLINLQVIYQPTSLNMIQSCMAHGTVYRSWLYTSDNLYIFGRGGVGGLITKMYRQTNVHTGSVTITRFLICLQPSSYTKMRHTTIPFPWQSQGNLMITALTTHHRILHTYNDGMLAMSKNKCYIVILS